MDKITSGILIPKENEYYKPFELASKFQSSDPEFPQICVSQFERSGDTIFAISTDGKRLSLIEFPKFPDVFPDLALTIPQGISYRRIEQMSAGNIFIPFDTETVNFPKWRKLLDDVEYMEHAPLNIPTKKQGETYGKTSGGEFSDAYNMFVNFTTTVPISFVEPFQGLNVQLYRDIKPEKRKRAIVCYDTDMYRSTFILMGLEEVFGKTENPNYFIYIKGQHRGPLTLKDFEQKIKAEEIDQYTLVWKDGMTQVAAMGSIPELRTLLWKKERHIAAGLRYDVLKRDKHRCQSCGRTAGDVALEVDHIIPISKGGTSTMDNLITLCIDCNRGKSNK